MRIWHKGGEQSESMPGRPTLTLEPCMDTVRQLKCSEWRMNGFEIRKRVDELGEWFHNINLHGVQTAPNHFLGDYPAVKWRGFQDALPHDLRGKSVLDIGCNGGFYSIEMKRRGADRVVAIDSDEGYLAQARFAAEVSRTEIEF